MGIRERKAAPSLADFLKNDFLPFVKTKHALKPGTAEYYADGANMVRKCDWVSLPLDKISDQDAQNFAAKYAGLSASRINCGLRSLRRALNLAFEWGGLEKPVKITLAKGERQRDRVLTAAEWERYIKHCPQPWQNAALLIRGTGMRPGEVFALRWEKYLSERHRRPHTGHRGQDESCPSNAPDGASGLLRFEGKMGVGEKAGRGMALPGGFARRALE